MSAVSLTPDAVRRLAAMKEPENGYDPILQVINVKTVPQPNGQDRYRTILSDGKHYVQGMIATQLNHLIKNNQLQTNSVVRVTNFIKNEIRGRNVVIVLAMDVLVSEYPGGCIGKPENIEKAGALPASSSNGVAPAQPMYNRTNVPPTTNAMGQAPKTSANPYSPSSRPTPSSNPYGGRSGSTPVTPHAPISRTTTAQGTPITAIANLNMYQNRWTIKARVVSKSAIKTWSNSRGEGSLFSIDLLDSSGMDIRATFFKEAVDKFYPMINPNSVYSFSGGRLKVANAQYNQCKSQLEISFDQNAEVHLQDDTGDIKEQSFDFVKIAQVEDVSANTNVDVLGIVQQIDEVVNFVSKKSGKEMTKRDVTIVDDSGAQIRITLWGPDGVDFDQKAAVGVPVAFRRARVSDYSGKSLSASSGGISIRPSVPEAQPLMHWWETQGQQEQGHVKSLTSKTGGGMGGSMDSIADRKHIADIKGQQLGFQNREKGDYLSFKAHFTFIKKDKEGGAWYTACPNTEEPCRARVKVTQTTDGNWQCDRCHGNFPQCVRRWIFSATVADGTASTWVSLFDEQGVALLGATADQVFQQFEQDQEAYEGPFAKALYSEWIFKCRVKNEEVNGESRVKTTVVRMDPVDYVQESKDLIRSLEQMQV